MTQRPNIFCFITITPSTVEFSVSRDAVKDETTAKVLAQGADPYNDDGVSRDLVLSRILTRLIQTYRLDEVQIRSGF